MRFFVTENGIENEEHELLAEKIDDIVIFTIPLDDSQLSNTKISLLTILGYEKLKILPTQFIAKTECPKSNFSVQIDFISSEWFIREELKHKKNCQSIWKKDKLYAYARNIKIFIADGDIDIYRNRIFPNSLNKAISEYFDGYYVSKVDGDKIHIKRKYGNLYDILCYNE